jgi:uracil-DNA glycosylase family 4
VEWREKVAAERRAAYRNEQYWGRPVPSWGPADARIVVVGLAPAAHGGNRTGRIFTGDRSGDVIFAALHRAGLAAQATSTRIDDGQRLIDTRVVAPVHCAPPANKPTPAERDACRPWLVRDLELLAPTMRVVVALGAYAWQSVWPALAAAGHAGLPRRRPVFGHGAAVGTEAGLLVLGCYHPSQQNTFTGRLTPAMVDDVLQRATEHLGNPSGTAPAG